MKNWFRFSKEELDTLFLEEPTPPPDTPKENTMPVTVPSHITSLADLDLPPSSRQPNIEPKPNESAYLPPESCCEECDYYNTLITSL